METVNTKHWTSRSVEDFTYRIASDFLAQIELHNENNGPTKTELADRLERTLGRVSQMFNPGNITLSSAVRLSQASGMKVALVAYDDNDTGNSQGPINSEIFYRCWKHMGSPANFFELEHAVAPVKNIGYIAQAANVEVSIATEVMKLKQNAVTRPTIN